MQPNELPPDDSASLNALWRALAQRSSKPRVLEAIDLLGAQYVTYLERRGQFATDEALRPLSWNSAVEEHGDAEAKQIAAARVAFHALGQLRELIEQQPRGSAVLEAVGLAFVGVGPMVGRQEPQFLPLLHLLQSRQARSQGARTRRDDRRELHQEWRDAAKKYREDHPNATKSDIALHVARTHADQAWVELTQKEQRNRHHCIRKVISKHVSARAGDSE